MDKTIEIIVLGCGGSGGVPLVTGHWGACDPLEPKNRRTRPSIAIKSYDKTIVIDTGPDFHGQTLRENIDKIDAIIYTHDHADHVNGIDDVRYAAIKRRINGIDDFMMPIYATKLTLGTLEKRFDYMFKTSDDGLYVPLIEPNIIEETGTLQFGDIKIDYFPQIHGRGVSLGFRIGNIGYSTDASNLDERAYKVLKGIKTWIVDCGQYGAPDEHITVHPNLGRVLDWNKHVNAEKLYLTHLTPRQDYQTINNETPNYIECAYDGLCLNTIIND
jgi:phosphoribosyl 1,2-cyclic phosphate phosphodiesterase